MNKPMELSELLCMSAGIIVLVLIYTNLNNNDNED